MCRQAILHPETQEQSFLKEEKKRGGIHKVIGLFFLFFLLIQCNAASSQAQAFQYLLFLKRRHLKDVGSFGMQSVALPLPDVILFDWDSHDCFWGAVAQCCDCAAAKLSLGVFPCLSLSWSCSQHPDECENNGNSWYHSYLSKSVYRFIRHFANLTKYYHCWPSNCNCYLLICKVVYSLLISCICSQVHMLKPEKWGLVNMPCLSAGCKPDCNLFPPPVLYMPYVRMARACPLLFSIKLFF